MNAARTSEQQRQEVHARAGNRCEYCLLDEEDAFFVHEVDHIIAAKHGGVTTSENLALACFDCNRFNGSDIASLDPDGGDLVRLFNPRIDRWEEHFFISDAIVRPLSSVARATVNLLKVNLPERIEVRAELVKLGRYPG